MVKLYSVNDWKIKELNLFTFLIYWDILGVGFNGYVIGCVGRRGVGETEEMSGCERKR